MSGWIKLHRGINSHWIWENSDYLKWWLDILLEVNHTPSKVLIKGKIYECSRGEKLYSLDTWASRWKTNKSKVRRFLEMLQKDEMIVLKNETQTTRITVCKYDDYQENENKSETQVKRKRNTSETQVKPIQERKEEKERKEDNNKALPFSFYNSLINYGFDKKLVSEWLKVRKNKKATNSETAFDNFIREVEKLDCNINDILKQCVANSWSGFKSSWYKKESYSENNFKRKYSVQNAFGKDVVYLTDSEYEEKSKQSFNTYKLIE